MGEVWTNGGARPKTSYATRARTHEPPLVLSMRLDAAASVRPDDTIDLVVDLGKLHFFDVDTGETIDK